MNFSKANKSKTDAVNEYIKGKEAILLIDAKMSRAVSRIERAERLRKALPKILQPKDCAIMTMACGFESTGYKEMILLPYLKKKISAKMETIAPSIL